jgi:hypothetical protein
MILTPFTKNSTLSTIFKMAATIPHKFNIVQFQRPELIPDIENFYRSPFSKWPSQYHKNSTLFDFKGKKIGVWINSSVATQMWATIKISQQ